MLSVESPGHPTGRCSCSASVRTLLSYVSSLSSATEGLSLIASLNTSTTHIGDSRVSGCVSGSERKAKRTTEDLGLGSGYWDWMFGAVGFETGSHALVVGLVYPGVASN